MNMVFCCFVIELETEVRHNDYYR